LYHCVTDTVLQTLKKREKSRKGKGKGDQPPAADSRSRKNRKSDKMLLWKMGPATPNRRLTPFRLLPIPRPEGIG
jgi:hypothetical protein